MATKQDDKQKDSGKQVEDSGKQAAKGVAALGKDTPEVSGPKPSGGSQEKSEDAAQESAGKGSGTGALNPLEARLARGIPELIIPSEYMPTYGVANNPRKVGNLPSMYQTAWPSAPHVDNGFSLNDVRQKGYRPVEPDEVTTNWNESDKLHLASFDVKDGYVMVGDSILFIGHKASIQQRKKLERDHAARILTAQEAKLADAGIDVEDIYREAEDYDPLVYRN